MSDIKLSSNGSLYDVSMVKNDLDVDDSLNTAIILSLFTDRRITAEEAEQYGFTQRQGFWGDTLTDGDKYGSKLWTLKREKITTETIKRAKEYCEEALAWLVEDEIADTVTVTAERQGLDTVAIGIVVKKPGDKTGTKYNYLWENL